MITIDTSVCDVCGTCISVCPENSLSILKKLEIDPDTCVSCGKCVAVCPYAALDLIREKK